MIIREFDSIPFQVIFNFFSKINKTGLQPVSRPVKQVPLFRGFCAKSLWCQGCADKQDWPCPLCC